MAGIITMQDVLSKENAKHGVDGEPLTLRLKDSTGLYFVELKKNIFLGVLEVRSGGHQAKHGLYEVEIIRQKRLRCLLPKDLAVTKNRLSTDWQDSWVKRLQIVLLPLAF